MSSTTGWRRRDFLGTAALGAAGLAMSWPRRAAWAAEGPASPLRIVYYTDIHTRAEWDTPSALALAAEAINREQTDLVLCGGDLITDGFQSGEAAVEARWGIYREQLHDRIAAPVYTALGNHDLVGAIPEDGSAPLPDPREPFRRHMELPRTWYSLDAAGCHVVVLDVVEVTGGPEKYRGHVGDEQLAWLADDLARVDARTPVVLVTHMPLLTAFYQATQDTLAPAPPNRVVVNGRQVLAAFAEHNLMLVLQGHLHVNEMIRWGRTTFITGGAICGKWWRGVWHGTEEGFGVATLYRDRVEWAYRDYGWEARRPAGM